MQKTSATNTVVLVKIAVCSVIIAICAWICVPAAVPFTMQTFGVFFALAFLGGKWGSVAVAVYIFMGAIGIPVFAGGSGGFGVIISQNGGYMVGWLVGGLLVWATDGLTKNKFWLRAVVFALALVLCYAVGTIWFTVVYAGSSGSVGLWTALVTCVAPFVIPDLIKIGLAMLLSTRINKILTKGTSQR